MSEIVHTYLNTLIFTIVAKVLTLILLLLLYFYEPMRRYLITILIVQVGLLLVIIFSLWNVISADRAAVARSNAFDQSATQLAECPHYFVTEMSTNADNVLEKTCKNTYAVPGDSTTTIRFKNGTDELGSYTISSSDTFATTCSNATDANVTGSRQPYPLTDLKTLCYHNS